MQAPIRFSTVLWSDLHRKSKVLSTWKFGVVTSSLLAVLARGSNCTDVSGMARGSNCTDVSGMERGIQPWTCASALLCQIGKVLVTGVQVLFSVEKNK